MEEDIGSLECPEEFVIFLVYNNSALLMDYKTATTGDLREPLDTWSKLETHLEMKPQNPVVSPKGEKF